MDTQFLGALITAGVTAIAGILGYLTREYRNRAKPFVSIASIEGGLRKNSEIVSVPKSICEKASRSFILQKLSERDTLDSVHKTWDAADDICRSGGGALEQINLLIKAFNDGDKEQYMSLLPKYFENRMYEKWLTFILANGVVVPDDVDATKPDVIPVYSSDDNRGCVWFDFAADSTSFGVAFNESKIVKEKCAPFIYAVAKMDVPILQKFFKEYKKAFQDEMALSQEIAQELLDILEANSRWDIHIYIANLGRAPFLVNKSGVLEVKDETGASFSEKCYLVLRGKDDNGKLIRSDAQTPLVVASEDHAEFSYFTTNAQDQMDRGKAFRDAFDSQKAKCRVHFKATKPGLIRTTNIQSVWTPFES